MTDFWNENTIIFFIQFLLTNHFLTINHCSVNTTTSFIKTFWCCLTFSLCQTNLMIFLLYRLFWPWCNFSNLPKCLNQFQFIKYNRQLLKVFHPLTPILCDSKIGMRKFQSINQLDCCSTLSINSNISFWSCYFKSCWCF